MPAQPRGSSPLLAARQPCHCPAWTLDGPQLIELGLPACRAYLQQLNSYRQRSWSCKYTGASGLTYEEAILSEQRVGKVVEQVGPAAGPG